MTDFEFIFKNGIQSKNLIFDPSVFYYLMNNELINNDYKVYIPDNLLKIIESSKENYEYKEFLKKFLFYFSYDSTYKFNWDMFYKNIEKINVSSISIENIEDKEEYEFIISMFKKRGFYVSMSPKINFLGDILAKIIEFSKQSNILILSRTRKLSALLREKIAVLELPKKFDKLVEEKQQITSNLFNFSGGKTAKFFIGIILSSFCSLPSILGLIFAFMDP